MPSILAISGGPDSVYLLHQLLNKGEKPVLAHFNHELRHAESDADEAFVQNLAAQHGLMFEGGRANVAAFAKNHKMSVETAGRTLRYEFLEKIRRKYRADRIYVAHHLNDNLETVLINERRGCNVRGRIGMRKKSGFLHRPLLDIPRADILAYLKKHNISFRMDASNEDRHTLRNRLRHDIIPRMLEKNPSLLDDFRTQRTHAIREYDTLTVWANDWLRTHPDCPCRDFLALSNEHQQFLLQHVYARHHGSTFNLTTAQLREVQKMIRGGRGRTHRTLGKNLIIRLERGKILFREAMAPPAENPLSPTLL